MGPMTSLMAVLSIIVRFDSNDDDADLYGGINKRARYLMIPRSLLRQRMGRARTVSSDRQNGPRRLGVLSFRMNAIRSLRGLNSIGP